MSSLYVGLLPCFNEAISGLIWLCGRKWVNSQRCLSYHQLVKYTNIEI
jgi:hypothetical protein